MKSMSNITVTFIKSQTKRAFTLRSDVQIHVQAFKNPLKNWKLIYLYKCHVRPIKKEYLQPVWGWKS